MPEIHIKECFTIKEEYYSYKHLLVNYECHTCHSSCPVHLLAVWIISSEDWNYIY